ncbi:uncharacterized protein LOC126909698 [Daktulosphaira vitifoliae]|uniref:uncharacterized protein LOC126906713 n=1 Tax=Daktulosphaira vitifoliae TaxID=58002 RepID=UPI0021AA404D|nr:uncharacterized protein LOC126906713 [Daktulosphaira vitifoliae]XP_050548088.1 uncharacterized protein LOC126909698 [Daktulosphaira vitifoliae]
MDAFKKIKNYYVTIFSFVNLILKGIRHNLGLDTTYFSSYSQTEEFHPEKTPLHTFVELSSRGYDLKFKKNGYSDVKSDLKKTRSSPYNIYQTFPFRNMSSAVFKRTPSPRLKELIEKFDSFFYDKGLNLSTNAVHNSNVLIKSFGIRNQL